MVGNLISLLRSKPCNCNKYITTNLRYNTFNKIKCYAQEIYYFMQKKYPILEHKICS